MNELRAMLGTRIFGATFTKADGSTRTGRFRLGVRKDQTGQGMSYSPEERGNLIVWDMDKSAYRTIKLDRLKELRAYGHTITWETAK